MVERGVRDVAGAESETADTGPVDIGQQPQGRRGFWRRSGRTSAAPQTLGRSREIRRKRGFSIFKVLGRLWVPLVILAVVVAGGFAVSRLHGIFGSDKQISYSDTRGQDSKPFNPKHIRYEVFGAPGTVADISYFDVNGDPQHLKGTELPWTLEFAVTSATSVGNVIAQGDSDSIGCRILVDNVVKSEKTSNETSAFAFCLLKNA